MTTTETANAAKTASSMITNGLEQTNKYIDKCEGDARFKCLAEGKATPLWLIGHMACVADFTGNVIGLGIKGTLPGAYRKQFMPTEFGGDPITSNAGDYPDWDEVVANYRKVIQNLAEGVGGMSDSDLGGDPKGDRPDQLKELLPTLGSAVAMNIMHDSHHRGQLAMLVSL